MEKMGDLSVVQTIKSEIEAEPKLRCPALSWTGYGDCWTALVGSFSI